jgi:hypothetical protein
VSEKKEGKETASQHFLSAPGLQYSRDYNQLQGFAIFVVKAATVEDARIALAQTIRTTSGEERPDLVVGTVDELAVHLQLFLQMMLCRSVDNFLTYVSELLALIFQTRPEMLKSNETAKLEMILQFKTMDDLISALVEKRVSDLAYQGMGDLSKDLSRKIGFDLFEKQEDLERAVRIIEVRNLIVHNRAIVNRLFLSRLPGFTASLGDRVDMEGKAVLDDIEFLASSVSDIDKRAIEKFGLPTCHITEATAK